MKRRVVVTGLGVVTSLSCQVEDLWKRILAGESGVHDIRLFDTTEFKVKFGGDVHDWSPTEYIDHKEAKRLDRFSQFALVAGTDAVSDSGIDFEAEKRFRCGVILGSGIGGLNEIEMQIGRLLAKGPDRVSALTIPKMMLNAGGGNLAIKYGMRGANYSVATACASATNAIGDALMAIQNNDADVMVTGGTEAALTPMGLSSFQNMRALSRRNDEPAKASRPFDIDRDGFVLSEGAGIMIFEELEHAKARGARIYCEVLGFGASCDAGHITQPDEHGTGAAKAMSLALEDASLDPTDVDYINAHGTSTPLGDKAETQAVKRVYGDHAAKLSISSTKSQLGHDEWERLDIMVNNAGITRDTLLPRMSDDEWDDVINTNLRGAFLMSRAAARIMMRARYGRIINISSVSGLVGNAGQTNYSASKAGLIGMTRSLSKELAGRKVTVNAVAPGFIESEMTAVLGESIVAEVKKRIPAKRLGKPEDVGSAVLFLASSAASYITGQVLTVDGGLTG